MQQLAVTRLAEQVQAPSPKGTRRCCSMCASPGDRDRLAVAAGAQRLDIPMQQIPAALAEIDPQRPVLALCHHGMRLQVALFLERQGYPAWQHHGRDRRPVTPCRTDRAAVLRLPTPCEETMSLPTPPALFGTSRPAPLLLTALAATLATPRSQVRRA
ncbi:MAG: hypothetical protein U1F21_11580 [Sphaerotilus natans]